MSDRLASEFSAGRSSLIVLYTASDGTRADDPAFQQAVAASLAGLAGDARVAGIVDYSTTKAPRFLSTDGRAT